MRITVLWGARGAVNVVPLSQYDIPSFLVLDLYSLPRMN